MEALRRLLLVSLCLFSLCQRSIAEQIGVVKGRLAVPGSISLASSAVLLHTSNGKVLKTFCDSDGSFVFHDVPPGSHMLQAQHMQLVFPEVRLDVSKKQVLLRAALAHNRAKVLATEPLLVPAAAEASFYEKRKPVDIWSFIKSPYGIMIVFSLFAIFVFPAMKVDPEEYKEMQAQLRGGGSAGAASGGNQGNSAPRQIAGRS